MRIRTTAAWLAGASLVWADSPPKPSATPSPIPSTNTVVTFQPESFSSPGRRGPVFGVSGEKTFTWVSNNDDIIPINILIKVRRGGGDPSDDIVVARGTYSTSSLAASGGQHNKLLGQEDFPRDVDSRLATNVLDAQANTARQVAEVPIIGKLDLPSSRSGLR